MPIIPPGYGLVSIVHKHALLGREAVITFGIDNNSGQTDPSLLATAVWQHWTGTGSMKAQIDSDVTIGPTTLILGQDASEPTIGVSSDTTPGGNVGAFPPPNVALLVHKRTARGGRRGRGRMFIPWCVSEASVDEAGNIAQASVTALNTALLKLRTDLAASQLPMVVLHSVSDAEVGTPTAPGNPDLVTALLADPRISTQRRRLGR